MAEPGMVEGMLDRETMEDLLISALEGGSNYWYFLDDLSMVHGTGTARRALSQRIFDSAMGGARIPVTDKEELYWAEHLDPPRKIEPLGYLTREGMELSLSKMLRPEKGNRRQAALIIAGDWDADSADVWFQFAVMGKQVYA